MARNGDIVSGCCWSGGGTGMLMTEVGSGVVGARCWGLAFAAPVADFANFGDD